MESQRWFFRAIVILIVFTKVSDESEWFSSMLSCDWKPDVTVAGDGSGDYRTITEAVAKVPEKISRFVIYVKEGLYLENVIVSGNNVVIYGDGIKKTIVSGNLSRNENPDITTFQTATFSVLGKGFIARDMAFLNTAGPEKNQAVAFHSKSNHSVLYRCAFHGYQDTLYAHVGEQLYRECDIVGTVDFIFGKAAAVFQMCTIRPRNPLPKQVVTVTAQGADGGQANSGFAIVSSRVLPYNGDNFTAVAYLGRPWRSYATVVVMETEIGKFIHPKGWLAWNSSADPPPPTVTFGEYRNYGPGSEVSNRVKWVGYNPVMTDEDATKYTVDVFINQQGWLKQTCVPYNASL